MYRVYTDNNSSSSATGGGGGSSSSVGGGGNFEYGSMADKNGKTYRTIKIGEQTWMAENLNYPTESGSWCYENSTDNCEMYGRLYDREAAKTICPPNWHLPDTTEWNRLMLAAGGRDTLRFNNVAWFVAGTKLKSKSGWNDWAGESGNGTDDFGFSALPGGQNARGNVTNNDAFIGAGGNGYWRTATENSTNNYILVMANNPWTGLDIKAYYEQLTESKGFSVRCIKD